MPEVSPPNVLDSLVRESPDGLDERGLRLVRHAGPGASLLSRVDQKGRLLRQELVLGREVIIWQHGTRVRTGLVGDDGNPLGAQFDGSPSRARLERARMAVDRYFGADRYLRHLSRVVQLSAGLGGAELVTRARDRSPPRKPAAGRLKRNLALLGAATFVVVFLVLRLLR